MIEDVHIIDIFHFEPGSDKMKFYIGNTDYNWYSYLATLQPEDVNFWQPGGRVRFKVIDPGSPFLFRLKYPHNIIAGVAFFSSHTFLPLSMAWDTFRNKNGCESYHELRQMISSYKKEWWDENPVIGCIVLTNPIFFKQEDWIDSPVDWGKSIVQGKSYEMASEEGKRIWKQIEQRIEKYLIRIPENEGKSQLILEPGMTSDYYAQILRKIRLGQSAFRVLITDAYSRKCSISGEKTLPVLEAAHIKPYSQSGPNFISNGLLLRSDIHKLFDAGYITVTEEMRVEVSRRIKQEYENGKEYYQYHGKELKHLPIRELDKPQKDFIQWRNSTVYKG